MKNNNMSVKERNLVKGAIRRVFSRSDLRKEVLKDSVVIHTDVNRPRVKKWSLCASCTRVEPSYLCEVDHRLPIIPLHTALEELTWDYVINQIFCDKTNLQVLCKPCHLLKSKAENKERREHKKRIKLK